MCDVRRVRELAVQCVRARRNAIVTRAPLAKLDADRIGFGASSLVSESAAVAYHKSDDNPYSCGRSVLANLPLSEQDAQEGGWPRERLLEMDARFVSAGERAIARGWNGGRTASARCARLNPP